MDTVLKADWEEWQAHPVTRFFMDHVLADFMDSAAIECLAGPGIDEPHDRALTRLARAAECHDVLRALRQIEFEQLPEMISAAH